MTRITRFNVKKTRKKRILGLCYGYKNRSKNCIRISVQKMEKALQYFYIDRKNKKRIFRQLWIRKINSVTRIYNIRYSTFFKFLRLNKIFNNRKILYNLLQMNSEVFNVMIYKMKKCMII